MKRILTSGSISYLLLAGAVSACTVTSAPPAAQPGAPAPAPAQPPPPAVASTSAALTQAPSAPAPAPAPPAQAPAPRHHHHPLAELFFRSVGALELKPEQKNAVAAIESDLEKSGEGTRAARAKLDADLADQVAAGKLERPKLDADVNSLKAAITSSEAALQDALNRLHQTLDAEQRKKLVATLQDKGREMREHHLHAHDRWAPPHADGPGKGAEHPGKGPPGADSKGSPGQAAPGKGPDRDGKGPHGHGEHGGAPKDHDSHQPVQAASPGGPKPDTGGPKGAPAPNPAGPAMGPGAPAMGPGGGGHFAKLWEELQLTPEQRQKIHAKLGALMKGRQGAMQGQMAAHEKHLAAIAKAFEGEKFDAKAAGVGGKAADMVKVMADSRIAFVQAVFDVLTPEQRAKFAAHLRAHTGPDADDDD